VPSALIVKTWTVDRGLGRGLDRGLGQGLDYGLHSGRTKCKCATENWSDDMMASIDGEVSANPSVIAISSTSDSDESDPETQESVAWGCNWRPQNASE